MFNFAMDIGNNQTKLFSEKGSYIFPSAYADKSLIDSRFTMKEPDDVDVYRVSGSDEQYYWGKGVYKLKSDAITDSISFTGRYTQTAYKNLCEFGLARLASDVIDEDNKIIEVNLTVGVPTGDFDVDTCDYLADKIFKGKHLVVRNKDEYIINVKQCNVLPQPIGTLYELLVNDKGQLVNPELTEERLAIADIGSSTLLLDEVYNGALDESNRTQQKFGINTLYRWLMKAIEMKYNIIPDIHLVETTLREGLNSEQFVYKQSNNNKFDITDIVEKQVNLYTNRIIEIIQTTFQNLPDVDNLIITGGGANVIKRNALLSAIQDTQITVIENPEFANVTGYYRYEQYRQNN